MLRKLFLLVFMAVAGCTPTHISNKTVSVPSYQESLTPVRLVIGDAVCSGTIVAPSIILSAGHCITNVPENMKINGRKTEIVSIMLDQSDHVLIEVNYKFNWHAVIGPRLKVGDRIHYWGNPAGMNMIYREGYVAAFEGDVMLLDVNGFYGDSGAGIFDSKGHLIGVINTINGEPDKGFKLMGATHMSFTLQQLHMAGIL